MVSLATLFGRASYHSIAGNLVLTTGEPRIIVIAATAANLRIILPSVNDFPFTSPVNYFFLNVGSNAFWVEFKQANSFIPGAGVTAHASDNSLTATNHMDAVPAGAWMDVSGFSNGANNGRFQVLKRSLGGGKVFLSTSLANEGPATVTVVRQKIATVSAGKVLRLMLGRSQHLGLREWYPQLRSYGAARTRTRVVDGGGPFASVCTSETPPDPPPPPPPYYEGDSPLDLSSCPDTLTVTLFGGTDVWTFWNGVFTLTKRTSGSVTYYRYIIDPDHWIDIRGYPGGGGYGYKWQVILEDLTYIAHRRFGNNSSESCPPSEAYVCFAVPAENTDCTNHTIACVVSA